MKETWRRLTDRLRDFCGADRGAAAVEFALVVPIMITLYIGSVEASALIAMDRKLQSVTGALGDLVARTQRTIPAGILEDYFKAAGGIMTPHPVDTLEQLVTQVEVENGVATVVWSRRYHNGIVSNDARYDDGDVFPLDDEMIEVVGDDGFVIVAEGSYSYTPLFGLVFKQPINLYRENFFVPRFGDAITVGP